MAVSRAFVLHSSVRAIVRRPVPSQLTRPLGRRGYAGLQARAAKSSDRPWQIAALAVTVPGVIYLRRGDTPKPGHDSQRGQATIEAAHEAKWSKTEPATDTSGKDAAEQHSEETEQGKVEESKTDEAVEHQGEADDSASASSSESDAAATPSGSAEGQPKAMDDSGENQAQKLTDKAPSQRVDPTEK